MKRAITQLSYQGGQSAQWAMGGNDVMTNVQTPFYSRLKGPAEQK